MLPHPCPCLLYTSNIETVADLKTVTDKAPTPEEVEDMLFANKIVKNSKSNAIVLAKDKQLLASGVGPTSRAVSYTHLDVYKRQPEERVLHPIDGR